MTITYFFDTQANVQAAVDKVYSNMVRARASEGDDTLYEAAPPANKITVSDKTDAELLAVPLFGSKNNVAQKESGFTTRWAEIFQCNDDNTKYWSEMHPDSTMNNGISCATAAFNDNWLPPLE